MAWCGQASKNVARRNPKAISPRVVLQALWREDVMAEEEEEREEYLSSSDEELDSADASRCPLAPRCEIKRPTLQFRSVCTGGAGVRI